MLSDSEILDIMRKKIELEEKQIEVDEKQTEHRDAIVNLQKEQSIVVDALKETQKIEMDEMQSDLSKIQEDLIQLRSSTKIVE